MIPILTYHGVSIESDDYAGNDHLALARDLETLHDRGLRLLRLTDVADWVSGDAEDEAVEGGVVITFDDGAWFDWYDLDHPRQGRQRSLAGILRDFANANGVDVHASTFLIASPDARRELDRTCLIGRGWWGDEWWPEAAAEGMLELGNHSWDHLHATLVEVAHSRNVREDFSQVDTRADADAQIERASDEIERISGVRPAVFAYPCGQYSDYLVKQYLPEHGERLGLRAAVTAEPRAVTRTDNPWLLPRFTFGADWKTPEGLEAILDTS